MEISAQTLAGLTGPVLRPGDPGFEEELAGYQTAYAHRPSVVVGAADAEDVRRAVAYAAAEGLPVGVQLTGHGLSVAADGGMLVSTRRMTGVHVDPAARTARIAAGARWGDVIEAAGPHGLAPLSGSTPTIGAVGYTLGGGLGLLARQYGYAADHVRSLEVVTADGRLREVRPGDELYGALLGGGGNFGIVTALEADLFPVSTLYGGQLVFDTPLVAESLAAWRRWTAGVPEEMTSSVTLIPFPDVPQLPEFLRGRYVASFRIAYNGPAEEGERLVAPLRAIGPRLDDNLRELPYTASGTIHNDPDEPNAYAGTSAFLGELPVEAIAALLKAVGPDSPVPVITEIRHLGGALRRGGAETTVEHRAAEFLVVALSGYFPGVGPDDVRARHGLLREALVPWTLGHSLNFLYGDGEHADETQVRAGYEAGTYERLAALKATYDPQNVFRLNRNVRPA
ncbi:FAD-binding oxidoreductase [Streptomyces sp. AV19]|uniref:FAD-binding oxidoreductase n=1 Tax=Streptomyces sp. AV19 TaxID=2793068 RepID=UPI0018FEB39E|nr:FAD-binding oxidoreductase [Streptomyces sp. AV19]MBH1937913.1 FAD-binding oxidoreductase [Streptomyces sp. AV19]MDG4536550.1 FAD-binding oxidoreductase [Streptomyces sp. AV19]